MNAGPIRYALTSRSVMLVGAVLVQYSRNEAIGSAWLRVTPAVCYSGWRPKPQWTADILSGWLANHSFGPVAHVRPG